MKFGIWIALYCSRSSSHAEEKEQSATIKSTSLEGLAFARGAY